MPDPLSPLDKDVTCRANMLWRAQLDPGVSADRFLEEMQRDLFRPGAGGFPGLAVLDHVDSDHRVIFLPRSGRIQIRLDALTRHEDRIAAAQFLYDLVRQAAFAAATSISGGDGNDGDTRAQGAHAGE